MFKIGEFSKMVRVSARMLRYYEKCELLKPAEIDRSTGYRMYNSSQISHLSQITTLRDMGFGVEEIREIIPHYNDAVYMQKALEHKQSEIKNTISLEQNKLEMIAAMSGTFSKENKVMIFDVELKNLPCVKVLSLRETIASGEMEFGLWGKIGAFMEQNSINSLQGGYSIYHDEEYKESDLDVEIAVPVDGIQADTDGFIYKQLEELPSAATIRFSGSYENYTPAMEKLALWIEQNGYEISGAIRGFAITMPSEVDSPDDYMTELQVSVKKA